jgi:hypothetical protein
VKILQFVAGTALDLYSMHMCKALRRVRACIPSLPSEVNHSDTHSIAAAFAILSGHFKIEQQSLQHHKMEESKNHCMN